MACASERLQWLKRGTLSQQKRRALTTQGSSAYSLPPRSGYRNSTQKSVSRRHRSASIALVRCQSLEAKTCRHAGSYGGQRLILATPQPSQKPASSRLGGSQRRIPDPGFEDSGAPCSLLGSPSPVPSHARAPTLGSSYGFSQPFSNVIELYLTL
jgi:hypothetical protein